MLFFEDQGIEFTLYSLRKTVKLSVCGAFCSDCFFALLEHGPLIFRLGSYRWWGKLQTGELRDPSYSADSPRLWLALLFVTLGIREAESY